ncbi:MAG: 30S ribosomal protein S7 [Bacteroidota bacterium]
MRKKKASRRIISPDPRFDDVLIAKFINNVMKRGKKHLARRMLYNALDIIEEKTQKKGIDVFKKALQNTRPLLEVRARRVGGATYQVPTEVRPARSEALAIRWLINYSQERKDKSMSQKLAAEFMAAANNEGAAIKKRDDVHKMAEANKAFAHFKW